MPANSEYIEQLKHTLRNTWSLSSLDWRALVEDGLGRMYPDDIAGLASMVHVIASELDSRGHFDEALAELDHIAKFVSEDPDSLAMVLAMRSGILMAKGRGVEAAALAGQVSWMVPRLTSDHARATAVSSTLVVRLSILEEGAGDAAAAWLASKDVERSAQLFVASWHIPYLFATGDRVLARPWIRSMKVQARTVGHPWRESDAVVFAFADARGDGWQAEPDGAIVPRNHLAASRYARLQVYSLVRREDWEGIEAYLGILGREAEQLGHDAIGGPEYFRGVVEAFRDGEIRADLAPPAAIHLGNLAAILAGAEAVGYAGSQIDAARWLAAWETAMPRNVRSSLEWPASADRIRGILALRAGQPRLARRSLEAAVRWCTAAKHNVELRLSQLQLAELFSSAEFVMPEQKRMQQRRAAWTQLREVGVPPAGHVSTVWRAISQSVPGGAGSRLTPRETEVVALLAEGLTYRAIGEKLGIRTPTVQTLAHRLYEKLGVSGKMAAVAMARELGIL